MIQSWLSFWLAISFICCACDEPSQAKSQTNLPEASTLQTTGDSLLSRFNPPDGFQRIQYDPTSFGHFLRSLPLKKAGSLVHYYDGTAKETDEVYAAVVDLSIGNKNLHQCADAVIRLRADYLRHQKRSNEIHFHFTNGFDADYQHWMDGYRIQLNGNQCEWKSGAAKGDLNDSYWKYLENVFMYAGTLSLSRELQTQSWNDMEIGDVLIQGGSPGHVVIVVDMAENPNTHEKMFMLAQSYMPAQETQILYNPNGGGKSVWYPMDINGSIETPEWTFEKENLKRFL
jgi:hypothetical protein